MKIYLFRHAEKASHFHPNPPLSAAGLQQAQILAEKVQSSELSRPTQLWVSPKLRAQQSFQALAEQVNLPLQIKPLLDEHFPEERSPAFRQRIQGFLDSLEQEDGVVYLCTHSDWIEEALALIPCDEDLTNEKYHHWSPLQYIALQRKNDLYSIIDYKRIPL